MFSTLIDVQCVVQIKSDKALNKRSIADAANFAMLVDPTIKDEVINSIESSLKRLGTVRVKRESIRCL